MFLNAIKNKISERIANINGDSKTKTLVSNVKYSVVIKIVTVAISFLSVPLLINYLNSTQYGIWLTILTFTSWFTLFDLGLGNGLKNKLIEFITKGNMSLARKYVTTTYMSMSLICILLCIIISLFDMYIPWDKIFNVPVSLQSPVATATTLVLIFTLLSMILKLINNLLYANQQSFKVDIINFITQLTGFIALCAAKIFLKSSLVTIALVFTLSQLSVLIIINVYLFRKKFRELIPSFVDYDFALTKEVMSISGRFFFIQIAGLIMYMTDNFIIANLFGPKDVTVYNIALKYFTVLSTAWALIIVPLWPMITKAYYSNDLNWIKKTLDKLLKLLIVTIAVGVIMFFLSGIFYKIWVGRAVYIPSSVSLVILLYSCISIFATIMATFINGTGKITLQAYITGGVAVINIPLAIFFSKVLNFELIGVPLATAVCLLISSIFAFLQVKKIISVKAAGIWDK
ncbi:oligosaccharide flippase family protein [Mucilaginibacter corticis]|uniref:oligosaccharide flippase family protein n=1 Tax=Mucilaginibacter corticis TaxID=2597670 RepID=UPI001642C597|nr:oligosaccharide flippase family protein [Mucilaginibacter corticis]